MTWTPQQLSEAIGGFRRQIHGMVRRMQLTQTAGAVWQALGHVLFDVGKPETRPVENFSGIGFLARPPDGSTTAEAIVIQVGGQNTPVIIASKDEAVRALVNDIGPDEAVVFNKTVRLYLRSNGKVEIRTHGGTASALATLADLQTLVDTFNGHSHSSNGAPPTPAASDPAGTSTFRAE